MSIEVRVVEPADFGAAAANAFVELTSAVASPVVGLPTGNTPVGMFEALRQSVVGGRINVSGLRQFAIDEYVGDPQHACSNRSYFVRYWDSIQGAEPVVQFDPSAADLERDVRRVVAELEAAGGLDVAIVGVGTNGHLAFNEPGSAIDAPARVIELTEASRAGARPCWGGATPTRGMTLGMREIMAARHVLLIANGSVKEGVVYRSLSGEPSAACPASWLQLHPDVTVVVDSDAYRR